MTTEPVTQKAVDHLIRAVGPVAAMICELHNVDLTKGRGVLQGSDRCMWTKGRRRITVCLPSDGGLVASIGKEPDPECPV